MSSTPAKRGRGRPKGSKNKRRNLSTANVREICDFHKFNPAEKLIRIATDSDFDATGEKIAWDRRDQLRATEKLYDGIHGNKAVPGIADESTGTQYEIVFVESADGFELPGAGSTEGAKGVLSEAPIQRAGLSSSDGQDGIRHQYDDTQGIDLSPG